MPLPSNYGPSYIYFADTNFSNKMMTCCLLNKKRMALLAACNPRDRWLFYLNMWIHLIAEHCNGGNWFPARHSPFLKNFNSKGRNFEFGYTIWRAILGNVAQFPHTLISRTWVSSFTNSHLEDCYPQVDQITLIVSYLNTSSDKHLSTVGEIILMIS